MREDLLLPVRGRMRMGERSRAVEELAVSISQCQRSLKYPIHVFTITLSPETRRQTTRLLNPSDPLTTELALNATLKSMGLYASKTVGDGNCMFRALSDQIWGVDEGHGRLRQEVSCDYLFSRLLVSCNNNR
jgi:hypothetical protein